jgi:hypothetical protein
MLISIPALPSLELYVGILYPPPVHTPRMSVSHCVPCALYDVLPLYACTVLYRYNSYVTPEVVRAVRSTRGGPSGPSVDIIIYQPPSFELDPRGILHIFL